MLNTDLHDPNIKEHMTIEGFSKNVYSTKMFDHISKSYLDNIYKSLSSNSLKVPSMRLDDYSKNDELYDLLKSKRNFVRNKKEFFHTRGNLNDFEIDKNSDLNNLNNNKEEDLFISDFNYGNLNRFIFDLFDSSNNNYDKENILNNEIKKESIENPLETPKLNKIINFVLSNISENFNIDNNFDNNNHNIKKCIFYLLWEDIFYNFMGINGIFNEIKDQNLLILIDKICLISQALNKKDVIDKLIVR